MSIVAKKKPNDGSAEEALFAAAEIERQRKETEENANAEQFALEAERNYAERQEQKKEELEKLRKLRSRNARPEEATEDGDVNTGLRRFVNGKEVESQKVFNIYNKKGIFNTRGERRNYGQPNTQKAIENSLKHKALGVSVKKQREFIQLLDKFHGINRTGQLLRKSEVEKLEAGLRRGESDAAFKRFGQELKEEGRIKNVADVKKIFRRGELRRMTSALIGKETNNPFKRADRTELIARRLGKDPSGQPPRPPR